MAAITTSALSSNENGRKSHQSTDQDLRCDFIRRSLKTQLRHLPAPIRACLSHAYAETSIGNGSSISKVGVCSICKLSLANNGMIMLSKNKTKKQRKRTCLLAKCVGCSSVVTEVSLTKDGDISSKSTTIPVSANSVFQNKTTSASSLRTARRNAVPLPGSESPLTSKSTPKRDSIGSGTPKFTKRKRGLRVERLHRLALKNNTPLGDNSFNHSLSSFLASLT